MDVVITIFVTVAIATILSFALSGWMIIHDKAHRLWWIISATLLGFGIACFIALTLIGSDVDEEGLLHEPFALIPIGYLLCFAGILSVLLRIALNRLRPHV